MSKKQPLIYYENKHNKSFPDFKIKVVDVIKTYVYCETEFGLCKKASGDIGKYLFNVNSAINKTEFLINQFKKVHNNKYNYSLVDYKGLQEKVKIICPEHGEFEQQARLHIKGYGCTMCGRVITKNSRKSSTENFINRANLIHKFKYDYSKTKYLLSNKKVIIICPIHGEFSQIPNSHLLGYSCPKCGFECMGKVNSDNPTGWSYSKWVETSVKSKKFDSFKIYIIKCWNEEEEFYKIGRTFLKIKHRFNSKNAMPYNYKIIQIFEGESEYIFNLEYKLKNSNKSNRYLPKIKFSGMKECFNKIEEYEK